MENKQKLVQCYSCGNETLMNPYGEYKNAWDEGCGYYGYFKYQMYACPVCNKITLVQEYWDCAQQSYNENGIIADFIEEEIIYPSNTLKFDGVPKEVKEAFEAALKTRKISTAVCLVALRRTLEMICIEKGADGRTLWNKIEDLSNRGILPPDLKIASIITKKYGNIGAHDADADIAVTGNELNQIVEFVQYIVEYLYVLPAKINKIQEKWKNP